MHMKTLALVLAIAAPVWIAACGSETSGAAGTTWSEKAKSVAVSAEEQFSKLRESFSKTSAEQLEQLDARLAELKEKAAQASGEAKEKFDQALKDLEPRRRELVQKLEEAQSMGAEAWKDFTHAFAGKLEDLSKSIDSAGK